MSSSEASAEEGASVVGTDCGGEAGVLFDKLPAKKSTSNKPVYYTIVYNCICSFTKVFTKV